MSTTEQEESADREIEAVKAQVAHLRGAQFSLRDAVRAGANWHHGGLDKAIARVAAVAEGHEVLLVSLEAQKERRQRG